VEVFLREKAVLELILRQLVEHPVRTALSVTMIGVGLLLGLFLKALSTGMMNEKVARTMGIGADLMLQPPHTSYILGLGQNVMPASLAQRVEEVSGVEAATPAAT
jgi:ABC-type lipoprotein release transport system permease subunit